MYKIRISYSILGYEKHENCFKAELWCIEPDEGWDLGIFQSKDGYAQPWADVEGKDWADVSAQVVQILDDAREKIKRRRALLKEMPMPESGIIEI